MKHIDIEDIDLNNQQIQNALQLIKFTRHSIFLTGKAGTGKSTFLRYVSQTTKKKHIILAPTGIAAINAGGTTLHSFFKLPFHPLLPNDTQYSIKNIKNTLKYSSEKIKILKDLELIIIDEISMVRADIVDFIDKILRVYCRNLHVPFGGKQILMVGDIYQLEPIVKEDERQLLAPFYHSNFFFHARVFQEIKLISIEFQKVYRQKDKHFIEILDHIRTATPSYSDLMEINKRVSPDMSETQNKLAITLSGRRDTVDYINNQQLEKISGDETIFQGVITNDFPQSSLPSPIELILKENAQIIFVKNDIEKRWVNGTLGTVVHIAAEDGYIDIKTENGDVVSVTRETWSNMKYTFNEEEKKIEQEEIGRYEQFPIKLAWAITIHKSQGLTFNHVKIDFSGGIFAGGQAYVALSRCTSLEGLSLNAPIRERNIFINSEVKRFANTFNDNAYIDKALKESKADKLYSEAAHYFDEGNISQALDSLFLAIHSRYDIEKPVPRRLIRRKLNIINQQKERIKQLEKEQSHYNDLLRKLSVEYTMMGKDCEREKMYEPALKNYEKAISLWKENPKALRAIKRLQKNQ